MEEKEEKSRERVQKRGTDENRESRRREKNALKELASQTLVDCGEVGKKEQRLVLKTIETQKKDEG